MTTGTTTLTEVSQAAAALAGKVVRTPLVRSSTLDGLANGRLWLKTENRQRGGSYKLRGAHLAMQRIAAQGHGGVVTQSTGNHGIAVALAAADLGLPAVVLVPADASRRKVAAIRAAGARVVLGSTVAERRAAVLHRLAAETGYVVLAAHDDPDVIAGQGTATSELLEDAAAAGTELDAVVIPCGGGSGVAGACLAVRGLGVEVHAVEVDGCGSLGWSLQAGRPVAVAPGPTIADGLRVSTVGAAAFEIARDAVDEVWAVDDLEVAVALRGLAVHTGLVVEPSAAVALAGALQLCALRPGLDVGVLLTGGNVDPALVAALLGASR